MQIVQPNISSVAMGRRPWDSCHSPEASGDLIQAAEIDGNQFAYAGLLHGDTINYVDRTHRHLIVGYDDELAFIAEPADHIRKLTDVGIIKWSVYFIKYTKWSGLDEINSKQQCCCRERFFSTT